MTYTLAVDTHSSGRTASSRETAQPTHRLGTMLGGGARSRTETGTSEFYLCAIDLDAPARTGHGAASLDAEPNMWTIPCGFLVHALARHGRKSQLAVGFEKHGPGCQLFDLDARKALGEIRPRPSRQFYGHGSFSSDSSMLYAVESDIKDNLRGYVAMRETADYSWTADFPSYGTAPHDLQVIDDGATMVVSNGGGVRGSDDLPNVAYIETSSGRLLEKVEISAPHLNAGHLAIAEDGGLVISSAPRAGLNHPDRRPGGVSIRAPGKQTLRTLEEPRSSTRAMLGESLSIAVDERSNVAVITNPRGNLVTFWDRKTGEFIKQLRVPDPRGVALTLDRREFVLNFNSVPQFARIDANTLEAVDSPGNRHGYRSLITGSHATIWDLG